MNYQYDVFISYSRLDTTIADRICDALDHAGIKYFIDRQGIVGGGEFPDIIANAISNSHFFLFLASNNSYASKYTKKEIHFAFNLKPDSLLPYIIDDSELPISLKFTFSDINIRTIKDHPIVETLVPDLLKLLGREKEIDIQKERNWVLNYLQLTDEWKIYTEKKSNLEKKQQNQTDDLGFLLEDDDPTSYLWDRFISSLLKHEIIPVIGPEYQTANNENFHNIIIKNIAKKLGIQDEPDSFTQLVLSSEFSNYFHGIYPIYGIIDNILHRYEAVPSPWLVSFIESKLFPFIINTSFTPTIENEMIKVWRNVKCLNYTNNLSNNPHIKNNCFLSTPTICYLFGKHNTLSHSFAVTDDDIREFCKLWMLDYGVMDKVLYHALRQCHLLFIGYNPYEGEDSFLWKDLQRGKDFGHRSFSEFLEVIGKGIICAPEIVLKEINNRVMSQIIEKRAK